jgi:hypothetical protein
MTQKSKPDVRFEVRPAVMGWAVHVTWPSGKAESIGGFNLQYQAVDWIQTKSANWVVDKIMQDDSVAH